MPAVSEKPDSVEEFQGLYGPYQFSELLLQKIWHLGAYDASRLRDQDGRRVEVLFPGRWNRLAGPDFKDARLAIDGRPVAGDVEVHFAARDWVAHGHEGNPAFANVVLHVLLHPARAGEALARTSDGARIPAVSLLETLWHSLEEYAQEDSLLASTSFDLVEGFDALNALSAEDCRNLLEWNALERWWLKARFARVRIEKLGWDAACHATALEALGYRMNRIPMLLAAGAFPIAEWKARQPTCDDLWESGQGKWASSGVRPANHPRARLEQYRNWMEERPAWPLELAKLGREIQRESFRIGEGVSSGRKRLGLADQRGRVSERVCAGQVGGSRLDTLICDGFLPLLAARECEDFSGAWFNWFAGDAPKNWVDGLRRLQVIGPKISPVCNGWIQGVSRALSP